MAPEYFRSSGLLFRNRAKTLTVITSYRNSILLMIAVGTWKAVLGP